MMDLGEAYCLLRIRLTAAEARAEDAEAARLAHVDAFRRERTRADHLSAENTHLREAIREALVMLSKHNGLQAIETLGGALTREDQKR